MSKSNFFNKNKTYFKILFILFLVLMMMIPNGMVSSLIKERQNRKADVIQEIASNWGDAQTITGPILSIPYEYNIDNSDGEPITYQSYVYLLPEELGFNSTIETKPLKRSIYTALLYKSDIKAKGKFIINDVIKSIDHKDPTIQWEKAKINIGISDVQAMEQAINLNIDDISIEMEPGTASNYMIHNGVQASIKMDETTESIAFDYDVVLKGNDAFYFEPTGKTTTVNMNSTWPSPSFTGKLLPKERNITSKGFTAHWTTNKYNRNYPQIWSGDKYKILSRQEQNQYRNNKYAKSQVSSGNKFGVRLVEPVDFYLKNTRASKYALLIIGLSFGIFFFFEMIKKKKIHAIQYILIGFALTVFYLLLLSITEHLGFNIAYLISSTSTILLISVYAANILKYGKSIGILTLTLSALYAYIFIILQLEDYALLAGSLGLFLILTMVMFYSRKIDWYALQENEHENESGVIENES